MPTYDFKCKECDEVIETTDRTAPICKVCKKEMQRVWSAPGILFKGKGFYKTGG